MCINEMKANCRYIQGSLKPIGGSRHIRIMGTLDYERGLFY